MNCPKCRSGLHEITFEGVTVDFCSACKGMWCDHDELAFMAELPEDVPQLKDVQATARQTEYPCPRCGSAFLLEEMRFTPAEALLIDLCPQCQGIWLDHGEFRKLESIAARQGDLNSRLLLVNQKLAARGYQILGLKAEQAG
jgi:uncharacterized protein